MKKYDPFENVQTVMEQAAILGKIDRRMFEIIKNPQRETKVYLPVEMDDGSIRVFEGYRVQHSNIRGPFKGGIRYHQNCDLNEIKALATGNPYIKEKMDLDIQVSKLKLMKANHTSQKYRLEDNITQHYPHQIAIFKERIEGFTADMNKYAKNKPEDKEQFFMQVGGKPYTDKKEAGTAIIAMCKEIKGINASADVGEYLGFKLNVTFDSFNNKFVMNVKGAMSHPMEVGSDPLGNITRINNVLEAMPIQLEEAQTKLSNVEHQLETAKAEVDKPFPQEAELSEKLERLAELNSLLNMDEKGDDAIGMDDEAAEPEKPQETVKTVDNKRDEVADMPAKQSNLGKTAMGGKLSDRPAEQTSLQEKLAAMKARVSGTPAGRDAVDKAKGKDQIL